MLSPREVFRKGVMYIITIDTVLKLINAAGAIANIVMLVITLHELKEK